LVVSDSNLTDSAADITIYNWTESRGEITAGRVS
jgi:hypothetical protein